MFPGMPLPSSTNIFWLHQKAWPVWTVSLLSDDWTCLPCSCFQFPWMPSHCKSTLLEGSWLPYTVREWGGKEYLIHIGYLSPVLSDATLFYQPSLSKHKSKDKVGKNFKTTITGHKTEPEVILTTGPYGSARSHTYKPGSGSSLFKWLLDLNSAKLLGNWVLFSPHDQLSRLKTTSLLKGAITTSLLLIDAHFVYLQPPLLFWITGPHIKLTTRHLHLDVSKEPQTWSG